MIRPFFVMIHIVRLGESDCMTVRLGESMVVNLRPSSSTVNFLKLQQSFCGLDKFNNSSVVSVAV
jgi:hypothetical protein